MSSVRVSIQQSTLIMASFMSDQLEQDLKRSRLVDEGKLSQAEADERADEWEKEEWEKRWQVFPSRLLTAFAKFQVVTLVMRSYEYVADRLSRNKVLMDKLTMDPFHASQKIAAEHPAREERSIVVSEMFHTTFWANLIAFVADYSVHQALLCFGYYVYVQNQRKKKKPENDDDDGELGAVFTSLIKKSTQLAMARGFGLVCSAAGGAVGTLVWPGWGAMLGSSLSEGMAGVIMDDGQPSTTAVSKPL